MKTTLLLMVVLCASPIWAQTRSALEQDPDGWVDMLPQEDLKGWKRVSIPPTLPLSEEMQWRVDAATKTLICSGKGGHEWLMGEEDLSNFILHVEWKFAPLPGEPKYNSGVGIRLSPLGEIWHQAQTGQGGAFLFGRTVMDGGLAFKNLRKEMSENRVKPVGEWNTFEVRAEGGTLALWVNGAEVNRWTGIGILKGRLGFEGEGYGITFRNIKLKKLP
jgi:3-keto-disaccharide hydrolase